MSVTVPDGRLCTAGNGCLRHEWKQKERKPEAHPQLAAAALFEIVTGKMWGWGTLVFSHTVCNPPCAGSHRETASGFFVCFFK